MLQNVQKQENIDVWILGTYVLEGLISHWCNY